MRDVILLAKGALFFLWCLVMVPPQILVLLFTRGPAAYTIPQIWHRGICRIFGLRVVVTGTPLHDRQTLFVANHVSYLDIPVMGSILRASFVAKNEVAGWPVFGWLSRLQQTAFISRSRADAQREKNALSNMIAAGKSIILFPEGTSTDGRDVAPFKSSLFSLTLENTDRVMTIQPVTLVIETVDGHPATGQDMRDLYAWYGDMTMPPHLAAFTRSRGATIRLVFHPPIDPAGFADRKALADACCTAVRTGLGGAATVASGLAA